MLIYWKLSSSDLLTEIELPRLTFCFLDSIWRAEMLLLQLNCFECAESCWNLSSVCLRSSTLIFASKVSMGRQQKSAKKLIICWSMTDFWLILSWMCLLNWGGESLAFDFQSLPQIARKFKINRCYWLYIVVAGDCRHFLGNVGNETTGDYRRLPEIAWDYQRLPEITRDCQRLPAFAAECW